MRRINQRQSRRIVLFASAIFCASVVFGISQPYLDSFREWFGISSSTDAVSTVNDQSFVVDLESEPLKPEDHTPISDPPPSAAVITHDNPEQNTLTADAPPKLHTVKPGETLSSISIHYFGSAKYWKLIYQANKDQIPNKNKIKPGLQLIIPDRSE